MKNDQAVHQGPLAIQKVLLVEDDPITQRRLQHILVHTGYCCDHILSASTISEAQRVVATQKISLALVDIFLPDGTGVEIIHSIHEKQPQTDILVISAWGTKDMLVNCLRAGATGYALKERDDSEIGAAIYNVANGGAPIDPFIARYILDSLSATNVAKPKNKKQVDNLLTHRELQILHFVAEGMTNREIGEKLFISHYTVGTHIKHVYRKLAVNSRTEALGKARQCGLLS